MDIHNNARLSFRSRESLARLVIEQGATRKAAAAAFRVSAKTAAKWVTRFQAAGLDGLRDLSSRPLRSPRRLPDSLASQVIQLRRQQYARLSDRSAHRAESGLGQPHSAPRQTQPMARS